MIVTLAASSSKTEPVESSTLDTEETSVQIDSIPSYGATLRRSCTSDYLAAERVYDALDGLRVRKRAQLLRSCRSIAWFVRHDTTGEVQVASSSCKLRWCPVCANSRRSFLAHQIKPWLDSADHPKFLTLTMKHSPAPLEFQIVSLYKNFRELRRRKDFRKAITGGIWFFHIKRSKDDGLWHPHIHCLITGQYIPRSRLMHMWLQITFYSDVVHIRTVRETDKASSESARYAACPGSLVGLSLDDMKELVEAMHGKRICGTWGTGRSLSLRPEPIADPHHWTSIGSWQYVHSVRDSNRNANAILHAWHSRQVLPEGIDCFPRGAKNPLHPEFDWPEYVFENFEDTARSPP